MANPHPPRRWKRVRRTGSPASGPVAPSSGRRTSFLVFACTIPFAVVVLIWQHAQLMERLEGGGEYAAFAQDYGESGVGMGWRESVQQTVDVAKFVAYGSGA